MKFGESGIKVVVLRMCAIIGYSLFYFPVRLRLGISRKREINKYKSSVVIEHVYFGIVLFFFYTNVCNYWEFFSIDLIKYVIAKCEYQ